MTIVHAKSVTVADFTGTVTALNSQGSTTTVAASDLARPSDWNSGHNQLYTLSGNTTGNSTVSGTNVIFEAKAPFQLSGTGSTVVMGIEGHGINYEQLIGTNIRPFADQTVASLGQNSVFVQGVRLEYPLSAILFKLPVSVQNSSSAVSSGVKGATFEVGFYSRINTDTANTGYEAVTRIWSSTHTLAASFSSNASSAHSAISSYGNSTSYSSYTSSSAGANVSSVLHGFRELIIPMSTYLAPGEYWMAIRHSTSGAGTVGNVLNISNVVATHNTFGRPGQAINSTNKNGMFNEIMEGVYTVTSGALPASIHRTQINQTGLDVLAFVGRNV